MIISIPAGWTLNTTSGFGEELFDLTAPAGYSNSPTIISVVSLFGDVPHHSPTYYLTNQTQNFYTVVGHIQQCDITGDSAAFVQYARASNAGYLVLWIHYAVVYELILEGSSGIDPAAIQDAKGLLASVSWTSNTPPPQYTTSNTP
jgi:hypothetical protein